MLSWRLSFTSNFGLDYKKTKTLSSSRASVPTGAGRMYTSCTTFSQAPFMLSFAAHIVFQILVCMTSSTLRSLVSFFPHAINTSSPFRLCWRMHCRNGARIRCTVENVALPVAVDARILTATQSRQTKFGNASM